MAFRENGTVELKRIVVDDMKKEIVAFANCNGGKLYIGIEDDGTVIGLDDVDQTVFKDRHEFTGSLLQQLSEVYEYIDNTIRSMPHSKTFCGWTQGIILKLPSGKHCSIYWCTGIMLSQPVR